MPYGNARYPRYHPGDKRIAAVVEICQLAEDVDCVQVDFEPTIVIVSPANVVTEYRLAHLIYAGECAHTSALSVFLTNGLSLLMVCVRSIVWPSQPTSTTPSS